MSGEPGTRKLEAVDQAAGNSVSEIFYEFAKQTWDRGGDNMLPVVEYGDGFTSFRGIPLDALGMNGYIFSASTDGIGTKAEVSERMEDYRTIGRDLVAMSCDDAVIRGGQPFAITDILDANTLEGVPEKTVRELAEGLRDGAQAADVAVLTGEAADLGKLVGGYGTFNYNWSSTALWMVRRERIIDNTGIDPDDLIVGFEETGLRSNGYTEARGAFERDYGEDWHEAEPEIAGQTRKLGELALQPSVIYSRAMVDLTGGCNPEREPKADIRGAAHITGGGIPEKLGRILKTTGLGAEIVDPFDLPPVMALAQFHSNMSDEMVYCTWHGGQGMISIVPESDADTVIETASKHNIAAKVIGYVTERPGIRIRSRGLRQPDKMLNFEA